MITIDKKRLKIYQIFHNKKSYDHCCNSKYIIKLSVNKNLSFKGNYKKIKNIKYFTNQLAESRAFYYAFNNITNEDFIGFTCYRHNSKFKNSIKIEKINPKIISKCFNNKDIKVISFSYVKNFIARTEEHHPRMTDFLFSWFKKEYNKNKAFEKKIRLWEKEKYFPWCNCFIMKTEEFKEFFNFFSKFIDYIDKNYNINRYNLEIPVYDKSRGWGFFCERIICFYLFYKYANGFKIAYITRDKKIKIKDRICKNMIT